MTARVDEIEAADAAPSPGDASHRGSDRVAAASVVAAALPIVVAVIRAIRWGWIPIGDNAYFQIRSRDVFSAHPPLLGSWTSASISVGKNINNPGPMLYNLLAVPVRLSDDWGVAIGCALLNVLAVIGIALVARRIGGAPLVVASMAMTAATEWAMGSELLYEPWQPHILILPFLCLLMMVWALLLGDVVLLPFAAFVASFILQTHIGYLYLVAALVLWAMAGLVWHTRRSVRDGDPTVVAKLKRTWKRAAVATTVVLALCWAETLFEQLTSDGEGNLSRLASSAGSAEKVGLKLGVRVVASILSIPPFWSRPSFGSALRYPGQQILPGVGNIGGLSGFTISLVSLAVLVLVLAAALRWARRRQDPICGPALATALVAIVVATMTTIAMPVGVLGIAPHQVRWLWPIGIFATFGLILTATRSRTDERFVRAGSIVFAVVAFGFAAATLPAYAPEGSGNADHAIVAVERDLNRQMGPFEGRGTVLFDPDGIPIFDPYPTALQAELQRRGVDFVVDDAGLVRQLGEQRANHGQASVRLFIREGSDALNEQPGAQRVALVQTDKIIIAVFLAPITPP